MKHIFSQVLVALFLIPALNANAQSTTYSSPSSSPVDYTVPAGCTSVIVDMKGGKGGAGAAAGGNGGSVVCSLAVTPGQILKIYVGGQGGSLSGGVGGSQGGAGGAGGIAGSDGGGGGGSSDIRVGGTTLANRVIVAAGGGGGCTSAGAAGGSNTGASASGGGGTQSAGGAAGTGGTAGTQAAGGTGRAGTVLSTQDGGGGGGGGYWGGGGGNRNTNGGGGGSNYVGGAGVSGVTTNTQGTSTGNGSVSICARPNVGAITGSPTSICKNATTTLSNTTATSTATKTWSSGNTGVATVNSSTGVVTGVAAGTANITCTIANACESVFSFVTVTVLPDPNAIAGNPDLCPLSTTTLTNSSGAGTWISSNTTVATINSSGVVSSTSTPGTTTITFTLTSTGCRITRVQTVQPLPAAIGGTLAACNGASTTLTNASTGGTWLSLDPSIASVSPSSGTSTTVTGLSVGVANIKYTLATGCSRTAAVSILAAPIASLNPTTSDVCIGSGQVVTATANVPDLNLVSQNFNSGIGSWSLNTSSGPAANGFVIIMPPNFASGMGDGSAMLQANAFTGMVATTLTSPSFSTMNLPGARVKFNMQLLSQVPDATVNVEYSLNGSAVWTPIPTPVLLNQNIGTGSWSASAPEYSSPLPAAAINQSDVRVRWNYNGNYMWAIDNIAVAVDMPTPTFAWTGPAGLSCSNCATPTITPTSLGANVYSVTATSQGCTSAAVGTTVSVNPLPNPITGFLDPCVGTITTLNTTSTTGSWAIDNGSIASINASTGVLTGLSQGTATVSYSFTTGCRVTAIVSIQAAPAAIAGTAQVCNGFTTQLSHAVSAGTWVSGATGIASISGSGLVSANAVGNASVTYTLPSGCTVFKTVTVNEQPTALTGPDVVCELASVDLSSTPGGGTWATADAGIATVTGGTVTGTNDGTVDITYTLPAGCFVTKIMTVNITPDALTGTMHVCEGLTTALSSATNNGTWASSVTGVATVATDGVVTGVDDGTTDISYTLPNACYVLATVTVDPLPQAIAGPSRVCRGATIQLTDADGGGTWGSGATGVAGIASDGTVSGVSAGNAPITYTLATGCITTTTITVDPLPANITGTPLMCKGLTAQLGNATNNGSWSSSATGFATVSATGLVTGQSAGNATISYVLLATGCYVTRDATVNPLPVDITGTPEVCVNSTTQLTNTDAGGLWISGATGIATVGTDGVVSGVAQGNANITYMLPTGCITVQQVTVDPLPAGITGPGSVCEAGNITLANVTDDGTWVSSDDLTATIGSTTGDVAGIANGGVIISYVLPTGCLATKNIIVNPLPADITGDMEICKGFTSLLENATNNGSWSSSATGIAPVSTGGTINGLAAGNANIRYTLSTGCYKQVQVTIDPLPAIITGTKRVCEGLTIDLSSASGGGTWQIANTTKAQVDVNGVVTGIQNGTTAITYTLPTGCLITANVTVNQSPGALTGNAQVCENATTILGNMVAGGTWSGGTASIATITNTGTVNAIAAGNTNVTYTLPFGCKRVDEVTVNPLPADIMGDGNVCVGSTETLTDADANGTWASSDNGIADINSTGDVSGISAASATITYTLPTGCLTTRNITIDPLPAPITGNNAVCEAGSTPLFSFPAMGTWYSNNTAAATISASGVVSGVHAGLSNITYTLATGCYTTTSMLVNPAPPAITGDLFACAGATSELSNAMLGGSWSNATDVAQVNVNGIVTGIAAGTTRISYKMGTGCAATAVFTVNPLPAPISGAASVCMNASAMATSGTAGGSWSTADASKLIVDATTGVMTGVTNGTGSVVYTLPTGCLRTRSITIYEALPAITGASAVCQGSGSTLSNAAAGGVWTSNNTSIATVGSATGTVSGLIAGSATVVYAMPSTGCRTTYNMVVNPLPAPVASANVCAGANTTLVSATHGGTWASADDAIATIDPLTGVVTGVTANVVGITYVLPTSCRTMTTVVVRALPVVQTLSGGGDYCEGTAGGELVLGGSENAATYRLYRGASLIATGTAAGGAFSFGHFDVPGTYSVNATNLAGCNGDMTGAEVITMVPTVTPTISMGADVTETVCAGTMGNFVANITNGGPAPVYAWYVNSVPVGAASTYSYIPADGDVIKAVLTSNAQCATSTMVSAMRTMTVMPNLTPAISLQVLPGDTLCEGDGAMFNAAIANGGDVPTYTWLVNGSVVASATGTTYAYTPANGDLVICKLNSNYRCPVVNDVASNAISMKVFDLHIPAVTVIAEPGLTINRGQLATFVANVVDAGIAPAYQWQINEVDVAGATNSVFETRNLEDGDVVRCNVQANGLCGKMSFNSVTMTVLEGTNVGNVADRNAAIRLIPNPTNGHIVVSGEIATANGVVNMQITDMLGQVVYSHAAQLKGGLLNEAVELGNELANGMYLLHIDGGSVHSAIHFVLKK